MILKALTTFLAGVLVELKTFSNLEVRTERLCVMLALSSLHSSYLYTTQHLYSTEDNLSYDDFPMVERINIDNLFI